MKSNPYSFKSGKKKQMERLRITTIDRREATRLELEIRLLDKKIKNITEELNK